MARETGKLTKLFRIEILKPVNYTWQEFGAIVLKAAYWSAQIANEMMAMQHLLSKGYVSPKSSLCSMITKCKETPLSTRVKCAACQQARLQYRISAKRILRADISLPTFKNSSLYIVAKGVTITKGSNDEWVVRLVILPGRDNKQPEVILRTKGLREKSNGYYQILEKIASKEYKLGFCHIRKDKVRKKLYLMMSYTFENHKATSPIPAKVMGVDLGVATPAYCAFNDNVKRLSLFVEGDKLLRVKRQIQSRRRKVAMEVTKRGSRTGHGVSGKFHPTQQLKEKWVNFRRTWNHTLSSRIVEYALKEQASTIHIEDLATNGIPRFLGKDWPVVELTRMITYKGEQAGLKVNQVNPYKTSQTCSRCGTIKENFTFKDRIEKGMPIFTCDKCSFQDNADYNAAKNIAKSTLITK